MLIVAGPSGAGKSAFLRELAEGRLPADIVRHLPEGAHTWREVYSNVAEHWRPLLNRAVGVTPVPGIAVHYDVTLMWRHLGDALELDPFWEAVKHCDAVTVVSIRPSRKRLIRQWIHAHLGVRRLWAAHCKTWYWSAYSRAGLAWRRLTGAKPDDGRQARPFPRLRQRILEWEQLLQRRLNRVWSFRFYRGVDNVEQMMGSWDRVAGAKLGALTVKHIELKPARTEIAKTFRWRVQAVNDALTPASLRARVEVSPALTSLLSTVAALC